MQKLVLASNNAGKLREFKELLAPLHFEVISQGDLGIPASEEPHHTFVENALAKARHTSAASGMPALADDSGICVEALGGQPGVYSARYAGKPANDAANNQKLMTALHGVANRAAHYVCALVMVQYANDPEPLIVQSRWHGLFLDESIGSHGFGYDPHFFLPDLQMTAAQLTPEQKNFLSHRGKALRELISQLQSRT